jgi:hypothetical protein
MEKFDTVSRIIAISALAVSFLSLSVSALVGWYNSLKPAEIRGDLSYIVVWRFSSNNDGVVTDTAVTPAFWLRNTGARAVVIKDLRIVYMPINNTRYETYPVSSVPLSAIENCVEFNEYGRLNSGSPFRGFSLTASEMWISSYKFHVSSEVLPKLVGEVNVMVQISTSDNSAWKTVIEEILDFGKVPYHLQEMLGGVQSIPIYTKRWKLRGNN